MANTVTITIKEATAVKRFQQVTYKQGRAVEQPNVMKQVYNIQADSEDSADAGLTHDSYQRWLYEAVRVVREYMTSEPTVSNTDETSITLLMPSNWEHYTNAPGLKYAMLELILNGMLADWYDTVEPDSAVTYKKKAELNKAEIKSIIYSLSAPSVTVSSNAGTFADAGTEAEETGQ